MDYSDVGGCTHDFTNDHLPVMVSSMNSRLAALALVFLVFIAAPTSARSDIVWFYSKYGCPPFSGSSEAIAVTNCEGQCFSIPAQVLRSGASSILILNKDITCSLYSSVDCSGNHRQSAGVHTNAETGCTNSTIGSIKSARCYINC